MRIFAATIITLAAVTSALRAQETGIEFFERKIRPVLVEQRQESARWTIAR
jgi:hypothetical protein